MTLTRQKVNYKSIKRVRGAGELVLSLRFCGWRKPFWKQWKQ